MTTSEALEKIYWRYSEYRIRRAFLGGAIMNYAFYQWRRDEIGNVIY
jgi:hypothetical protein